MGFKKIDHDELKTKISPNFLGIPIREGGKLIQKSHREKKIESSYTGSMSEVLILNEEFMEFHYQNDGARKAVTGNGNISIFNNSVKDRIWDANLQFSGSQFNNQKTDNNLNLGIFEPNSNKVLKYEIVNSDDLPDLIEVSENIENLSEDIKIFKNDNKESDLIENETLKVGNKKNYLLLLGKENKVKFSINIVNISTSILENIKFKKSFTENFYDLEFNSNKGKEFKVTRNSIDCSLNNLNPGEKVEITILAKLFPKKKENIKTGNIEITFNLSNKVISGVKINHFSAYSHAMHAIKKTEKNHAPNNWQCSLIFENHSDFKLKLNSVLVYDKSKTTKILDLDFKTSGSAIINPRGKYKTESFDCVDEKEPTFSRKVEYSVDYRTEKNSMITSRFDDSFFIVVNIVLKKKLSEEEIKSFEETVLNSKIIINNQGTIPINGLRIVERVPEDFLPSRNISDYTLSRSSGKLNIGEIELNLKPDDEDPTHEHTIELNINLKNGALKSVIEVDDFLELKYPLKAMTPDYKKAYDFPLNVSAFYSRFKNSGIKEFYMITNNLSDQEKSSINISHKRRKVMVGKQIYPGRSANEFAIYIVAKNGSSIKLNDVNITDTIPESFELISSNIEHKLSKSKKNGDQNISFTINALLPYQEREIMYYLKSISGKEAKYSELESYFVG
ncbi:MAG: hypothetical protein CEE43_11925 [Promethearchaeota archaeon Loki_b32]|nr:MAG: hypothetical protein CEE43_11925 [Candidatus Lokiarchaeota archaeon Loki_b32]